jgi:hypothetical protein
MEARQTTRIDADYLMTLHAPSSDPPQRVDGSLTIYRAGTDGWAKGPKINGTVVQPTADWVRATPSGALRVDARMIIRTDDGALIYVSYSGVISVSPEAYGRMASGGTLTADDMYFVTTPIFQTAHERYAWLNHVQAIGKVVAVKGGDKGFVRYDVYAVR